MGDYHQTANPASPLGSLCLYNGLQFNRLRGKIRFATFCGETVYLVLVTPLEEEDLGDLAAYLSMWWRNDYCRICFQLDRRLETVGLRTILAGSRVELVLAEGEFDALAPARIDSVGTALQPSTPQDHRSGADVSPEPLTVG